ncbi:hypothetical protein LMG28614_01730 [Paraburkholderia ultramafica]|uniref:MarR family transcriptional regulator n=1 Tax=Paraburkholderia ultramafica TaxID=1544867 RepID=A0A6S7B9W0_9BURK|nr:hypothetical protein LMG28614_01730 [Paraburkholderia ultramafica]
MSGVVDIVSMLIMSVARMRAIGKAERTLGKARKVGDEVALEALNGFTDEETQQLIALLQRVRGNLSRLVDR